MKFIFIVYLLFSFTSFAQTACEKVKGENKPPLLLYTEHWPPYQSVDKNKRLTGITVKKIKDTLDNAVWPYEIKVYPWARAIYQSKNVENSFIFSVARFPEREKEFQWVAPLATVTSKLIRFNNNKLIKINSLEDIKNHVLILKRGEASSIYFEQNNLINSAKTIWVTDSSQALKLLEIGRGDIYPVTVNGFNEAIKSGLHKSETFSFIYDFKELDVDLYLATSPKTSKSIINQVKTLFSCNNNSSINK